MGILVFLILIWDGDDEDVFLLLLLLWECTWVYMCVSTGVFILG